ncbi:hypothetical protein SAMN05216228_103452 [Rhizobium tibeticum]|uniref:Uncharacterized protein n=1 Tax=Rhizobium tibeticum TaxID=501024 RepID=A0A1H8UIM4_9HYPH|nr:hypothetical protein [Rhizobium tibeticum]SEI17251.1 hypothetical protein RTCCBAU85039_5591 [Rhizobium tibeticum]SEP03045.1 hypothetical protein SAMN05216228_103452 [Rhizobium tibeticum]
MSTHKTRPNGHKRPLNELGIVLPKNVDAPPLNEEQQTLIEAYRLGRVDEKEFQLHLARDRALANYVQQLCQAPYDILQNDRTKFSVKADVPNGN